MRPLRLVPLALLVTLAVTPAQAYLEPVAACTLDDARIPESSGIAASSYDDDVLFTHNDSGDVARLFAIHAATCEVLATITVAGAEAVDWEDIARGPASAGGQALYIGDIGNNNRDRPVLTIYEIPEPVVDPDVEDAALTATVTASHEYAYDDGPQDAEGLFVDPATSDIYVVGKTFQGISGIYRLERVLPEPAPLFARTVARAAFVSTLAIAPQATGADIAPDGSRIAIRTYQEIFEWAIPSSGLADAFLSLGTRIAHPVTRQGEAITYSRDSADLITTTEGEGPLYRFRAD